MENVFRKNYLSQPPHWSNNLLDSSIAEFKKDELVSFTDRSGRCHVGRLKWMGSVPWLEEHLLGIECVSCFAAAAAAREVSRDVRSASVSLQLLTSPSESDDRFVRLVRVMDAEVGKAAIVREQEVESERSPRYLHF